MDVHFARSDLASLDQLKAEALCLPFFVDERPMRGAPGLVDFRLCGRISEQLVRQRMGGEIGEIVLMPARPRLMAERLLWVGAGRRAELDEARFCDWVARVMGCLVGLRVRTVALVLPGRVLDRMDAARSMDWFLGASLPLADHVDELTILDSAEAERAMQPIVERARRRALAEL